MTWCLLHLSCIIFAWPGLEFLKTILLNVPLLSFGYSHRYISVPTLGSYFLVKWWYMKYIESIHNLSTFVETGILRNLSGEVLLKVGRILWRLKLGFLLRQGGGGFPWVVGYLLSQSLAADVFCANENDHAFLTFLTAALSSRTKEVLIEERVLRCLIHICHRRGHILPDIYCFGTRWSSKAAWFY